MLETERIKLERTDAGGRESEQILKHPQPKLSPVQNAAASVHQEQDYTDTGPYRHRTIQPLDHTATGLYRHRTIQPLDHTATGLYSHWTIQPPTGVEDMVLKVSMSSSARNQSTSSSLNARREDE